jgi:hypothetical protein
MKRLLSVLVLPFTAATLLAQSATPDENAAAAAGAATAGILGGVCGLLIWGCSIALWLIAAIWVMRDAKRRNSPNATLVTVLTWIPCTWVIGLIVHLITRPKTGPTAPPPAM